MAKEILQLGQGVKYYINFLGRVSSDHKLSREEFRMVKQTVNPAKQAKIGQWNKWKSRAFKVVLVALTLVAEWLVIHLE